MISQCLETKNKKTHLDTYFLNKPPQTHRITYETDLH